MSVPPSTYVRQQLFFYISTVCARLAIPQATKDYPDSTSLLSIGMLGLEMCALVPICMWFWGFEFHS